MKYQNASDATNVEEGFPFLFLVDDYFVEYEDDSYGFSPIRDFFTPRERTIKMGDMRLTNTQYSMFFGRHRHKRSGAFGEHLRWPKGDIPYAFSKGDKEPRKCWFSFYGG